MDSDLGGRHMWKLGMGYDDDYRGGAASAKPPKLLVSDCRKLYKQLKYEPKFLQIAATGTWNTETSQYQNMFRVNGKIVV